MKHKMQWLVSALLFAYLLASQVKAATLDLFFYDQANKQVGSGQFSYNENKSVTVNDPTNSSGFIIVKNPIISFSAFVQNEAWLSDDNIDRWWSATGQTPGQGSTGRSGGIAYGSWFFGDSVMGTRQFVMYLAQVSNRSGNGTWFQSVIPDSQNPNGLFGKGTWSTSADQDVVPVPAAICLFGSGFIPFFWVKLLRKKQLTRLSGG